MRDPQVTMGFNIKPYPSQIQIASSIFCGRKAAGAMARSSVHQQRQRPPLAAVTQTANDPLCQMLRCCCCRK